MTAPTFLRDHAGALSSVALVVTWSSGFVGAELGNRAEALPLTLLGWRFTILAVLLVVVARVLRTPWPSWRAWRRQAVLALLCQAAYLLLVFEGVRLGVTGGTAALIAALQPLLVATVAGRLLGEPSTPRTWLGMALGMIGVGVVVSGDLGVSDAPLWAYLLPTAGMLFLAGGTVLDRRLRPPESLLETIMMQAVVTAVLHMVPALTLGDATPPSSATFWAAVAWLIGLSSLGGYVMYVFLARRQGATVVSTLLFLTPPTTMFWVYLMFGTQVTAAGLAGLAVSGVGVWLALGGRRAPRAGEPVSGRAWTRRSRPGCPPRTPAARPRACAAAPGPAPAHRPR